jgi:hypothetical protein
MLSPRLKALKCVSIAVALGLISLGATASHAAMMPYPDQGPVGGITFTSISESSITDPLPLFGPPTPFVVGLDFSPSTFGSSSTNGLADITDGQLNYTINGPALSISIAEGGDYSLIGVGTDDTSAVAGVILRATVTQINGVNIAPIILTPVNASVSFNLAANPGAVQPWSLGVTMDVAAQLTGLGYNAGQKATKIDVAIDNQLITVSEAGTVAFIAKKEFITTVQNIPEPATAALFGMMVACSLGVATSRSRRC